MSISNRHVLHSIKILRSLLDKNLYKNEIIEQTSKDRSFVYEVLDALEKGQLIEEEKILKRERRKRGIHTQAIIMQITILGRELIDILDSLEQYKKAYFDLKKSTDEYFGKWNERKGPIPDFKVNERNHIDAIRNKELREKGFTDEDLKFYKESDYGTMRILGVMLGNILEVIVIRCVLRLYTFNIIGITKHILNNILVDVVDFRISLLSEDIRLQELKNKDPDDAVEIDDLYINKAKGLLDDIQAAEDYYPVKIHKQVKNAILSYLSLLKPPKENIEESYHSIKSNLETTSLLHPTELTKQIPTQLAKRLSPIKFQKNEYLIKNRSKRVICLFDAYESYMNKMMMNNNR